MNLSSAPVVLSFVGTTSYATRVHYEIIGLAQNRFPGERVVDFGDPLKHWESLRVGGKKRELPPNARLHLRAGLVLDHLQRMVVPKARAGATVGIYRRLGFDTWAGAVAYAEDAAESERVLASWEAVVRNGILALGLRPPLYVHTDGNPATERLLDKYCATIPGQRYVVVPPKGDRITEQTERVLERIQEELRSERLAA